jgi:hypothetical protein
MSMLILPRWSTCERGIQLTTQKSRLRLDPSPSPVLSRNVSGLTHGKTSSYVFSIERQVDVDADSAKAAHVRSEHPEVPAASVGVSAASVRPPKRYPCPVPACTNTYARKDRLVCILN